MDSQNQLGAPSGMTHKCGETCMDVENSTENRTVGHNSLPAINPLRHSLEVASIYCIAYTVVFVLGICGNCFVVAVVARCPRMRNVTNLFIVNLALADILVLIFCLPATLLANIFVPWMLGGFMCKAVSYLQGVSVSASINTLVAISTDRFLAICCPLKCQLSTRSARRIIFVIWSFALLITLPWILFFRLQPIHPDFPEIFLCSEVWPMKESETIFFLTANLGMCYLVPLCFITLCYAGIWVKVWHRNIPGETKGTNIDLLMQRSKLKVVKLMLVVVVLFVLSWLPLYIIFTWLKLGGHVEADSSEDRFLRVMTPIAQWLGASNSCINPVLYAFFNKKFRKGFLAIVKSRSCCGNLRYEPTPNRNSNSTAARSTVRSRFDNQSSYSSTRTEV